MAGKRPERMSSTVGAKSYLHALRRDLGQGSASSRRPGGGVLASRHPSGIRHRPSPPESSGGKPSRRATEQAVRDVEAVEDEDDATSHRQTVRPVPLAAVFTQVPATTVPRM